MANRHPNKDIDAAVQYAIAHGWRLEMSNAHAWGRLFCPSHERGGCIVSVYSTPRNPVRHARFIIKQVNNCRHQ
jgi:hypothetical protein